jgi:hypothetical protein
MVGTGVRQLVVMRCPLADQPPTEESIFCACYTTSGLMPLVSPFLLTLLDFYGIQLQHLSPHSFVLVAIFIHLCEMFVGVRPSIPLFQLFHVLRWAGKGMNLIGTYYF